MQRDLGCCMPRSQRNRTPGTLWSEGDGSEVVCCAQAAALKASPPAGRLFQSCLEQGANHAGLARRQAHKLDQVADDQGRGVVDGVLIPFGIAGAGVKGDLHLVAMLGLDLF